MMTKTPLLRDPAPEDGDGGTGAPEFLPEELKGEESLHKFKDVGGLAKSYVELEKKIGTKRLEAPNESWDDDKWNEFYSSLGRPEKADDYELPELDGEVKFDEELVSRARLELHKLGLSGKQFRGALTLQAQIEAERAQASQVADTEKIAEAETALKGEWGDKYDANLDIARGALKKFGGDEFAQMLENTGLGNNPQLVKAFHRIGSMLIEDKTMGKGGGLPINDQTIATTQIKELRTDTAFQKSLLDPTDPQHMAAKQKWEQLFRAAYPGKETI